MDFFPIDRLDESGLKQLLEPAAQWGTSLLMPIQQEPDKRRENLIRLKNLVREATHQLEACGVDSKEAERLLAPAEALTKDPNFLSRDGEGAAIYLEEGQGRGYVLPWAPVEQKALAARHFYIRPLLPALYGSRFFILDLSLDGVRLLQAHEHGVERVALPDDVPQSMAEALRWDDPESQLQWHTGAGNQTPAGRAALFHGHAVGADETKKDDILRFFHLLDGELSTQLSSQDAPLVLAGVDYLLPLYEEANTYNHLVEAGVAGNHQHLDDDELLELVWPVIAPHFQVTKDKALERYGHLTAEELAIADLATILSSAYQGRLETLFLDPEAQRWGSFDGRRDSITINETAGPCDEELLNVAAIHTVKNGGAIYLTAADRLPNGQPAAAILRF